MLKNQENENLVEMLNSSDKDCVYLAVSMIRNSEEFSYKTKKLINKISLFDRIKNYSDVCKELDIEELTVKHFDFLPKEQRKKALAFHQVHNIGKLFNGDWKVTWDGKQRNYYPWFLFSASGLVVFDGSSGDDAGSCAGVCYYKDEETSSFVGKAFIDIYSILVK